MAFWNRNKNWEDEYDEYYAQDRRPGQGRDRPGLRILAHLLTLVLVGGVFTAGVGYVSGVTMVEKTAFFAGQSIGAGVVAIAVAGLLQFVVWPTLAGVIGAGWLVDSDGRRKSLRLWRFNPVIGVSVF